MTRFPSCFGLSVRVGRNFASLLVLATLLLSIGRPAQPQIVINELVARESDLLVRWPEEIPETETGLSAGTRVDSSDWDWKEGIGIFGHGDGNDATEPAAPNTPPRLGAGASWQDLSFDDSGWLETTLSLNAEGIKIQAEDYNEGGEGVAYHDTSPGNSGRAYRSDDVDIAEAAGGAGYYVTSTQSGEWLQYDVIFPESASYDLSARVCRRFAPERRVHFEIDGADVTQHLLVPRSSDREIWTTVGKSAIPLGAGTHAVRLVTDDGGVDVDCFEFRRSRGPDVSAQSLYLRHEFQASGGLEGWAAATLELVMEYRGGFVAYLNGREVARRNTGGTGGFVHHEQPAYNNYATDGPETWALGPAADLLLNGPNALAIEMRKTEADSADWFSVTARLVWRPADGNPADLAPPNATWRRFVGTCPPSGGLCSQAPEFSDWVELHNPTAQTVSLRGWSLTDDRATPGKWVFPDVALGPGGYLVVFASGESGAAGPELHANFKLDGDGEYLALYDDSLPRRLVFEFPSGFPRQSPFYSWGRTGDSYGYLDPPTPGRANESARQLAGFAATPEFSLPAGHYSGEIRLGLSCATPGAVIRYTTDGRNPARHIVGTDYATSLALAATTVVRARAFRDGYIPSPIATRTYLLNVDSVMQSLPVLSLAADEGRSFFDPHGAGAIVGGGYIEDKWTALTPDDYNACIQHGRS
ncbi:MAG TPA: carbohydrate-binding domain-containing protein, partial [Sumerlaeia bacterium]|nr:carbohydrate-binding domain-containing protein [Sumerlaeia bacterium]